MDARALQLTDHIARGIGESAIVRANYNMPLVTVRDRDEHCRPSNRKSSSCPLASPPGIAVSAGLRPVNRQHKPPDPACPGPGPHGVRSDRGSSRAPETSCRRRSSATSSRWLRRCSRRLALVTATSASTGAIMPGCSLQRPLQHGRTAIRRGRRRPGHGHRFPPPRAADGTRRVLTPPAPPGPVAPAAARALGCHEAGNDLGHLACTHCAPGLCLWSPAIWSGSDRRMVTLRGGRRIGWMAIACRAGVAGSGRVTRDRRLAGAGPRRLRAGAGARLR